MNYRHEIFILAKCGITNLAARLGFDGIKKADQRVRRGQRVPQVICIEKTELLRLEIRNCMNDINLSKNLV